MIHSGEAVQSENFEVPAIPPAPVSAPGRRRTPLPAEYYSAPPGDRPRLFAPWAATGCGIAATAFLGVFFAAGYFATHGGMMRLMSWFISSSRRDMAAIYDKDVTAGQRTDFDREMTSLQTNLTAKKVGLEALQPVLRDMRDAMIDDKVTSAEMTKLLTDLHTANSGTKPK